MPAPPSENEVAEAWTQIVAQELNAKVIGLGKGGSAHEHAIKTFNTAADITFFSWTEQNRLYHKTEGINIASAESEKEKSLIYKAAYDYYKYIHDDTYAMERQIRDLYWFDNKVLEHYK